MVSLAKRWEDGFHEYQPDIQSEDHLYSTATGIGGLYAGHADLAYMGRDMWPNENLGFSKTFGYDPTRFVAATGAYDVEGKTFPMVVFVNKDNPIKGAYSAAARRHFRDRTQAWRHEKHSYVGRSRPHRRLG